MKKIISLICILALAVTVFASCGGSAGTEEDTTVYSETFVPVEEGSASALYLASGSSKKETNRKEYIDMIVEAYNSITQVESYVSDEKSEWSFVLICGESGGSIYKFTCVGENKIDVSVTLSNETPARYLVTNPELYKVFKDEVLAVKEVSKTVKVSISLGEGTPDGEGVAREAEVVLGETTVTVKGDELNLPTMADAVLAALESKDITSDYTVNEASVIVTSINGYKDDVQAEGSEVTLLMWTYTLNGEAVNRGEIQGTAVSDGDVITVTYALKTISTDEN